MDNHWLPAKGSGTTHLNDHLQPWFSTAEFTEGQQLGTGQNLPLQQPENHGFVAKQALAEVGAQIARGGLPAAVSPLVTTICGTGNVSKGAVDALGALGDVLRCVTPAEL